MAGGEGGDPVDGWSEYEAEGGYSARGSNETTAGGEHKVGRYRDGDLMYPGRVTPIHPLPPHLPATLPPSPPTPPLPPLPPHRPPLPPLPPPHPPLPRPYPPRRFQEEGRPTWLFQGRRSRLLPHRGSLEWAFRREWTSRREWASRHRWPRRHQTIVGARVGGGSHSGA